MICIGIETVPGCGEEKSLNNFYEIPKGSGKYRKTCKACISKARLAEKSKYKELIKKEIEYSKNNEIELKSLSLEDFNSPKIKFLDNKNLILSNNEYLIEKLRDYEKEIVELKNNIENLKFDIQELENNNFDLNEQIFKLESKIKRKKVKIEIFT